MSDVDPPRTRHQNSPWEAIAFIVDAQVALGRHRGYDAARIRREINRAFNVALEDDCYFEAFDLDKGGPTEMLNRVGMFRLVFEEWGLDRKNQFAQESWYAVANRAMEEALQKSKSIRA